MPILKLLILLSLFVVAYQPYKYAATRMGVRKQRACLALGITYVSIGTVCFVFRKLLFAFIGLYLFMLGLLLIAQGLDRLNKRMYIDRREEDE